MPISGRARVRVLSPSPRQGIPDVQARRVRTIVGSSDRRMPNPGHRSRFADATARPACSALGTPLHLWVVRASVPTAAFDTRMCYLAASPRWRHFFGLDERCLEGQRHEAAGSTRMPAGLWTSAGERCLAGETLGVHLDRFVRADGDAQWLRWTIRPWTDREGLTGGVLVLASGVRAGG